MRALVQRVSHASVTIDGRLHGQIGQGFLVLLGITDGDTVDDAVYLADKTVKMRVFTDENDKMNRSLADVGGGLLHLGIDSGGLPEPDGGAVALIGQILPKEMALQMSKC